jgi:hypothetical protein
MKAILEFNLPEENEEYKTHTNANKMSITLSEYDEWLRGQLKYCELNEQESKIYQKCRVQLREIAQDNGLNLNEL